MDRRQNKKWHKKKYSIPSIIINNPLLSLFYLKSNPKQSKLTFIFIDIKYDDKMYTLLENKRPRSFLIT